MVLPSPIQTFLAEHTLATIATIASDNPYPHILPVFYVARESVVYFASNKKNKKLQDIISHPQIALSITDEKLMASLEMKGTALLVKSSEKKLEVLKKISEVAVSESKNAFPPLVQLDTGEGIEVVEFSVVWFRLSSYDREKPEFLESSTVVS